MKKLFFLLLGCLLSVSFLRCYAQTDAELPVSSGDWTYVANKKGITITDYRGKSANLVIPYEIDGKAVTQLGKESFKGNLYLRSVVIPGSVTSIGANAFSDCSFLESVQLSYDLRKIESGTFRNCGKLKSIYFSDDIRSIGSYAFENCYELEEVYMTRVTSIGESAFDNCRSLHRIIYPYHLTTVEPFAFRNTDWVENYDGDFVFIGEGVLIQYKGTDAEVQVPFGTVKISGAFDGNDTVERVILPETVREIGKYSFRNAVNLKSINIPTYCNKISAYAFSSCLSLDNVTFPNQLKTIANSAFQGCSSLSSISFPPRVTSIPSLAFGDCPALRTVNIPATVTKIDNKAFQGSDAVVLHITLDSAGDKFAKENGVPYQYPQKTFNDLLIYKADDGIHIAGYTGSLSYLVIPAKIDGTPVTVIDTAAFQNCDCVRHLVLPVSLKVIGDWAFSYMDRLEYIRIPAGVTSVGANVFAGSSSLRQVQIPRRMQTIGETPFDADTETVICATEGSVPAQMLSEMGYDVQPYDLCAIPEDLYETRDGSCGPAVSEENSAVREVLQIPDGVTVLTADMIRHAGPELALFVPASVTEIEEEILEDRTVTIVSFPGTAAESFARDHGLTFLVRKQGTGSR